ncbi:MAG: ionic transporter y4hA [Hyphomicrobium sp.]
MSLNKHAVDTVPVWSWAAPLSAYLLLIFTFAGLVSADSSLVLLLAALLLGASVFASVHHAEVVALRVGEPFGSIVLAIAVTVIEVALIVSIMLSAKDGADVLARDTVFATVMLVLNGIVGLCLVAGGVRHHEQSFQTSASAAALSVLGTLAVITMVLPNYTLAAPGPVFASSQLIFVGVVSVILYFVFLFIQTIRHRDYFLMLDDSSADTGSPEDVPSTRTALISVGLLCLALAAVVLLAKVLSPWLEGAVSAANLPKAFVGVVIAAVVLLPEGMAAVRAAAANRLQTSLNLALGSAMATIGLTIPMVAIVALMLDQRLTLGLEPSGIVLLLLTLFISTVTLATGRTTILQGAVHLVIFAVFMFLAAVP